MYARNLTPETAHTQRKGRPERRLATIAAMAALALSAAACGEQGGEPTGTSARADIQTSDRPARVAVQQPPEVATPPVTAGSEDSASTTAERAPYTYAEAETAYMARDYEEAGRRFESYLSVVPDNPWGFYMLGLSAWKAGDLAAAETALRTAIELDPEHARSHVNLGRVLIEAERHEEALAQLDVALGLDNVPADAYRVLGNALLGIGDIQKAVELYEFALALDPDDAWSMNNLGLALIRADEFDAALSPLARAIQLEDNNPTFHNNLGVALERSGHAGQALAAYENALMADPTYEKSAVSLARIESIAESGSARGSDAVAYGDRGENPGEGIDLEALAAEFVGRIDGWRSVAMAGTPEADSIGDPGSD